jgi:predicted transcriptional regulator of viral defense system
MQPMFHAMRELRGLPEATGRVFALQDLRGLLPAQGLEASKAIVARLEKRGEIERVCRGIYVLPGCRLRGSDLLGHVAARLRADRFNYLSLETVLSEAGVISQIPMSRIMLMSSGRSHVISCGRHGEIEFVHTAKKARDLAKDLTYDPGYQLWRASVALALRDMKDTRRDTGLVNLEEVHELV